QPLSPTRPNVSRSRTPNETSSTARTTCAFPPRQESPPERPSYSLRRWLTSRRGRVEAPAAVPVSGNPVIGGRPSRRILLVGALAVVALSAGLLRPPAEQTPHAARGTRSSRDAGANP